MTRFASWSMHIVSDKSAIERIAEIFFRNGVEFLIVGGQAELLFGSPRITYDVDLCYRRTASNLERLAQALVELNPKLRGAPSDLRFRIDAQSLALGCNFTFSTALGDLDLLGYLEPVGGYEELIRSAEAYVVGDLELHTISLGDLIKIKRHIRRPKDIQSLVQLEAIALVREQQSRPKD
ncbi:MAG: hypothetical protein L0Z55_00095 [Planctomycetes bacterium]|nr:hypothetical protein [Planctomycetota bacterium]